MRSSNHRYVNVQWQLHSAWHFFLFFLIVCMLYDILHLQFEFELQLFIKLDADVLNRKLCQDHVECSSRTT